MASVPAAVGRWNPQLSKRYQTAAVDFVIAEAHGLDVIDLAESHVTGSRL